MNKISTYRKQLGLSQRQLATHLGWIQSRLANYEANFRTPGLEECRKIVATLNHLGSRCVLDDVFPPHVNDSRTILAKVADFERECDEAIYALQALRSGYRQQYQRHDQ